MRTDFLRWYIRFLFKSKNGSPLSAPSYLANQKAPFELTADAAEMACRWPGR